MANPFAETQLELGVAQFYGASYSLNYDTLITTMGGGSEQRRINWDQGIIGIQLSTRVLNTDELTYLLAFHEARNGAYEGFRVKDWSDYKAINQPLGTGDGSEKTFQLVKIYSVAGVAVTRAITKPVAGTVKIYLDGIEQEDNWSVDTTTGAITTTLDGNLTASCEFDVPMRFEQDKIDAQFNAYRSDNKFFDGQGFSLIELRNTAEIPFDTVPQSLDHLFALYYDYGTIGGPEFSTSIIKTESGFEDRLQNWESSLGKWNVGNRRLNRAELDYFVALFRVCRGRGVAFNFKDWQSEAIKRVRFDEDKISFSFSGFRAGDEEVFFDLGGIGVKQLISTTTYVFGTYLSTGGPYSSNAGGYYYCNGGCNVYFRWRNIEGIPCFDQVESSFEVINGMYYLVSYGRRYLIDFIYSWSYISQDIGNNRGYPEGPFSPHGIGLQYNPLSSGCVQSGSVSPAYGESPIIDFTVTV